MRLAAAGLALLLGACVANPPHLFRTAADEAEQIAELQAAWPDDPATMAALSPGPVAREGRTLVIRTGARTWRLADRGFCEGFASCERWRAGGLHHGRWLGIERRHGEAPGSYFIVALDRGTRLFDIGSRPLDAPAPPLVATADDTEINQPILGGLAIVDLARRRVLLHRPDLYRNARIEAWEGPGCVRASHQPEPLSDDRQTLWMVRDGQRWAVAAARPAACSAAAAAGAAAGAGNAGRWQAATGLCIRRRLPGPCHDPGGVLGP